MAEQPRGYQVAMPGDDGLTPEAAVTQHDDHTRIEDKQRFAGKPEVGDDDRDGTVDRPDLDDALDQDPEDVSLNRRDVPDTPENSIEARTEDE
jgi:hypothetical protein